ncbi:MAG: endo-1,4-beta-xylanase, partial [Cyanobacteria bacterium P01_F01_bin.42]
PQGYRPSAAVTDRIERAELKLERATAETDPQPMAQWANESLKESLWSGEQAVFDQAKQVIARRVRRDEFLFGANFFGHPSAGEKYDQQFQKLFNFATLPFYWRSFEHERGKPAYAQTEAKLDWLNRANILPKGHPLVWFHEIGVPDWIKGKSYSEVRDLVRSRVIEVTRHFGDRIPYYDIINEAHDIAWANQLDFSQEQMLEMTKLAAEASAEGFPQVQRIVNTCCSWAKYVPKGSQSQPLRSAYQYLQSCIDAEIPFETIGIQLYYPSQDMFEIHRLLERFGTLGKPIHITELGVSSSTEEDEKSYFKKPSGLWHAPWSETVQADWIEQFYTLCYSKPFIGAVTWWDFADANFWPHGGFLRRDMTPKESFFRLKNLRQVWQSQV